MLRYIALTWDKSHAHAEATAQRLIGILRAATWKARLEECGFVLFSTEAPQLCALDKATNRSVVVLGDLFHRQRSASDLKDPTAVMRILETSGRELVRTYWGNYVAFLRDASSESRWVLRGPGATLPCLHVAHGGVDLYFSWTETCVGLESVPFSINWEYVARSLAGPLVSTETGITEIAQIIPGFCEETRGTRRVMHCYWDPVAIATDAPINDFDSAVSTLHDVTKYCVHRWAERARTVLHALSGGLDSSVVLGCLQDAPARPEITALTFFAEGADSDEREFARRAARRAGCRHIECHRDDSNLDLREAVSSVRLERSAGLRIRAVDRLEVDCAISVGAQAIYKGHGGDELFCRHHTQYYVADAFRDLGVREATLNLLLHSAVTEGDSIWVVLGRALRDAYVPHRWNLTSIFKADQHGQSLLRPELWREVQANPRWDLPFAQSTRQCSPGKLWQISLALGWRPYDTPSTEESDPPVITPLLSQPIIEACLRIPTYFQMANRRERAVARAAFTAEVPPEVLKRRWKGGAEQLAWKLFRRNLPFIRELLLDGRLVRERIVDRKRLESALVLSPTSFLTATVPVFELVGTELWLNAWNIAR